MTITFKSIIVWACLFFASLIPTVSFAQLHHVIATAGAELIGENRQVSFTIGEQVTQTLAGEQIMLTQGFHQPKLWVTAIHEIDASTVEIKAFPNPAINLVKLTLDKNFPGGGFYRLFDLNGGLIEKENIESLTTEIPVHQLSPSSYFLEIITEGKVVKTFKIIKK